MKRQVTSMMTIQVCLTDVFSPFVVAAYSAVHSHDSICVNMWQLNIAFRIPYRPNCDLKLGQQYTFVCRSVYAIEWHILFICNTYVTRARGLLSFVDMWQVNLWHIITGTFSRVLNELRTDKVVAICSVRPMQRFEVIDCASRSRSSGPRDRVFDRFVACSVRERDMVWSCYSKTAIISLGLSQQHCYLALTVFLRSGYIIDWSLARSGRKKRNPWFYQFKRDRT